MLSTTEAVHFGKPVVGIPVFFDQTLNMALAKEMGYGLNVPYEYLSEERLKSAIQQVLRNSRFVSEFKSRLSVFSIFQTQFLIFSYYNRAQEISQRFHDQQNTPMETV